MRTDKGGKGGVIINISSAAGITLDAPISLASFYLKVFIVSCEIYYLQVLKAYFFFTPYFYFSGIIPDTIEVYRILSLTFISVFCFCLYFGLCLISQIYQPF